MSTAAQMRENAARLLDRSAGEWEAAGCPERGRQDRRLAAAIRALPNPAPLPYDRDQAVREGMERAASIAEAEPEYPKLQKERAENPVSWEALRAYDPGDVAMSATVFACQETKRSIAAAIRAAAADLQAEAETP